MSAMADPGVAVVVVEEGRVRSHERPPKRKSNATRSASPPLEAPLQVYQ